MDIASQYKVNEVYTRIHCLTIVRNHGSEKSENSALKNMTAHGEEEFLPNC